MRIKYTKNYKVKAPKWEYGNNGIDFFVPGDHAIWELKPGEIHKFTLGVKFELPDDIFIYFCNKSSLGAQGINLLCPLVDSNYRGEVHCVIQNTSDKVFIIKPDMKICQGVIMQQPKFELNEVDSINENTKRGSGGFGSTGAY